ncbi:hypothetical protein [Pseudochelatococcus sp. G4_1912]|uniref:hypothetical protein n=1 Tax=Pseudochelatococcus sp. G4_1912 TaxID=3114288 RepID=UPI0039C66CE4
MNRPISDVWFHRVKSATRDLVKMAGGVVRAGEIAGVSKSEVSRWQAATDADIISLPAALALEAECGVPMVTTAMAELNGRRLTDPQTDNVASCLLGAFTGYTRESAELLGSMSQALADGKVTPAEAELISRSIADTEQTLTRLKMVMAGIKVAGSATLRVVV